MEQLINMERDGPVGGRLAAAVMQRTWSYSKTRRQKWTNQAG